MKQLLFTGGISLLFISSTVTMSIPFSLGKILDIIYTSTDDTENARRKLNNVCGALVIIFFIGAVCNFGRIYIMAAAGKCFIVHLICKMLYLILFLFIPIFYWNL